MAALLFYIFLANGTLTCTMDWLGVISNVVEHEA